MKNFIREQKIKAKAEKSLLNLQINQDLGSITVLLLTRKFDTEQMVQTI